jgi:nicotinate phosphoribosyltransferase
MPVNGVYKLVEIDGKATMKRSPDKATYPGRKQIFRTVEQGQLRADRLGLAAESPQSQEYPLLQPILQQGQSCLEPESLSSLRQRSRQSVESLPNSARRICDPQMPAPVLSSALADLYHSLS